MKKTEHKVKSSQDQSVAVKLLRFIGILPLTFEVMVDYSLKHCRTSIDSLKRDDSVQFTFFTLVDSLEVIVEAVGDDNLEFAVIKTVTWARSSPTEMRGNMVRVSANKTLLTGVITHGRIVYRYSEAIATALLFLVLTMMLLANRGGVFSIFAIAIYGLGLLAGVSWAYYSKWDIFDRLMDAIREVR